MLALTKLFDPYQRPTDEQITAALTVLTQSGQGGCIGKHPLFPRLSIKEFLISEPPTEKEYSPTVGCVLDYFYSLQGFPQGTLYSCQRIDGGRVENRLTCRGIAQGYIFQGRDLPKGSLTIHCGARSLFSNNTICSFNLDLGFEKKFVAIRLYGEANLVRINKAELAIAGFTTSREATQNSNVINNLCRWQVVVHLNASCATTDSTGDLTQFAWERYASELFGDAVPASLLAAAVHQGRTSPEAGKLTRVIHEYVEQPEIKILTDRLDRTIRELASARYQPLRDQLWRLA